jgi:Ca-activated chloride channel homolog
MAVLRGVELKVFIANSGCGLAMKSTALLFAVCLLSLPGYSQVPTIQERLTDPPAATLQKLVQEVDVAFTVKSRHGHLVRNLTAADISLYDNGQPPDHITYFESRARLPLRLALLVDVSDSMGSSIGFEKQAVKMFLKDELHPASDVALVLGFNEQARLYQSASSNPRLLTEALGKLSVGGNTALFDAIAMASRELGSVPTSAPSLKVIIVLSDGDDTASAISLRDAANIALGHEVAVVTLDTVSGTEIGQKNLKALSQVTGGDYFVADEQHIKEALDKVEQELRSQYVVGYKPSQTKADGSFHRISILAPKKLKVQHRQGYFAR